MLDTLEFTRRMVAAGMPEQTAERLAHELHGALPESDVATKADWAELRTDIEKLRTDFANLKGWVLLIVGIGQVLPTLLQLFRGPPGHP